MTEQPVGTGKSAIRDIFLITFKFVLVLVAFWLVYLIITGTHLGLRVEPVRDSQETLRYDDVVIVDNCAGVSPQVVPAHEPLPEAGISIYSLEDLIEYPLIESLGLGGATVEVSSDLLKELRDKQLARVHNESELKDFPVILSRQSINAQTQPVVLRRIAASHPIDTSIFPDVQVPPGVFNISTLRWNRTWESGVITVTTPLLPMNLLDLTRTTTYNYGLEVRRDFVGTKTEQLPCDSNLRDKLWDSWIDHFEAGDQSTAIALVRQMTTMYPTDGMARKALDALTNASLLGGLTISGSEVSTGQLQDGTDIAIRSRPCFPGKEGDSSVNYVSALRQREYVTILAEPVNDECGYDVKWSRIRTLEGLEGYVSSTYLLVPSTEPLNIR